jgi:hypothetical protein
MEKRPSGSFRAAGATPPVRIASSASSIASAFSAALRSPLSAIDAASPACCERDGTTRTTFSDSSAARSAAMITLALLGSTTTSSAGTSWMPARISMVEGLSVGPPSSTRTPTLSKSASRPGPVATASAPQHCSTATGATAPWPLPPPPTSVSRSARSWTCACMSATSSRDTSPAPANSAVARSGSSVCTWTFSVLASPTTSTLSPIASSSGTKAPASRSEPVTAKFVQYL